MRARSTTSCSDPAGESVSRRRTSAGRALSNSQEFESPSFLVRRIPDRTGVESSRSSFCARSAFRGFLRPSLLERLFPDCLDHVPATSETAANFRQRVDFHPAQIGEPLSAGGIGTQGGGCEDVRRRARLSTAIEFVNESIPDLFGMRRSCVIRGRDVLWASSVLGHESSG